MPGMTQGQIEGRAHRIYDDMVLGWTSSWLRPRGSLGGPLVGGNDDGRKL